jgi:hypothetical protein
LRRRGSPIQARRSELRGVPKLRAHGGLHLHVPRRRRELRRTRRLQGLLPDLRSVRRLRLPVPRRSRRVQGGAGLRAGSMSHEVRRRGSVLMRHRAVSQARRPPDGTASPRGARVRVAAGAAQHSAWPWRARRRRSRARSSTRVTGACGCPSPTCSRTNPSRRLR